MSILRVDSIRDRAGTGSPDFPNGVTFSGNVSIGGTLTYEDVTNIDSVGVITARSGSDLNGYKVEGGSIDSSTSLNGDVDYFWKMDIFKHIVQQQVVTTNLILRSVQLNHWFQS